MDIDSHCDRLGFKIVKLCSLVIATKKEKKVYVCVNTYTQM